LQVGVEGGSGDGVGDHVSVEDELLSGDSVEAENEL